MFYLERICYQEGATFSVIKQAILMQQDRVMERVAMRLQCPSLRLHKFYNMRTPWLHKNTTLL